MNGLRRFRGMAAKPIGLRPVQPEVTCLDNSGRRWQSEPKLLKQVFRTIRDQMKQFLLKLFTWWNGQTFGTQLWTWRFGELVGEDEQGNRYFRTRGGKIDPSLGFERRWVIYNGYGEASRGPPSGDGGLPNTGAPRPPKEPYEPHEWEKPHLPNMTGT